MARANGEVTDAPVRAGKAVTAVAVLMAMWCLGFAAVNIVFEATGYFDVERFSPYATTITVMDWLVIVLKLIGATAALLTIAHPRWIPTALIAVVLWGVFATLGVYVIGSLAEAVGILTGLMGDPDSITPMSVAYLLFFLIAAVGFGILAVAFHLGHRCRPVVIVVGMLGAPALLCGLLFGVPAALTALGWA